MSTSGTSVRPPLMKSYNQTKAEYYRQISAATSSNDLSAFVAYAMRGLGEGIRQEVEADALPESCHLRRIRSCDEN